MTARLYIAVVRDVVTKPTFLYISTWIPGSAGGGTEARAANHIVVLAELFDVTLAIVGNHGSEAEVYRRLAGNVRNACVSVVVISRIAVINRLLRRIRNSRVRMLFEALWPTPVIFAPYPPALAELGRRLAGQRFDVVHCFRLNTSLLRLLKRHGISYGRSVLDFDSYESQAEFRSIRAFYPLIGKQMSALSLLKALKWWALEALLIPRFDDVIVCSEFDRQRLSRRFRANLWHVVPNTVPEPVRVQASERDRFTFLFVGQLGYLPNWDAVLFFCMQVLPHLRRAAPGPFRVLLAGRAGGDLARITSIEEVQVIVSPPDLSAYYARSDAVIVPLRGGGGTRVKILEAFSYGLPVISTTIGAEGLEVTPGVDIIIADNADAFAAHCRRIWTDDALRRRIAAAGLNLWRREYSPATLVTALKAAYQANEAPGCSVRTRYPGALLTRLPQAWPTMIRSTVAAVVRKLAPNYHNRRIWRRRFCAMRQLYHEQELHVAPLLCDKEKTSIDIGAAEGIYTVHVVHHSRNCLAFEPRLTKATELQEMFEHLSLPVQVETVALSNVQGDATLRVLASDEGRSTIERDNTLEDPDGSEKYEITIPMRRLDDYGLDAVGFVKIDVEGHELSVLRGGSSTLRRCLPTILIEIEERHRPNSIWDSNEFLTTLGYEGYFILDRHLTPITAFDLSKHQNVQHIGSWKANWRRSGVYVNNFFFVPAHGKSRLEAAVSQVKENLSDLFEIK